MVSSQVARSWIFYADSRVIIVIWNRKETLWGIIYIGGRSNIMEIMKQVFFILNITYSFYSCLTLIGQAEKLPCLFKVIGRNPEPVFNCKNKKGTFKVISLFRII